MGRISKIEEHQLEDIISRMSLKDGLSSRDIASKVSEMVHDEISYKAIQRFLDAKKQQPAQQLKKAVIKEDKRRVLKTVHQEIDIIQTNLDATKRLIDRFALVDDLPTMYKEHMDELMDRLMSSGMAEKNYVSYLESWQGKFEHELRRKVGEIAILNREVRENMKFLVALREKAFQFELVSEFINLFMEIFKEESKDGAYDRSVIRIASNPRMKQLADQLKLFTGGDGE